MSRYQAIKGFTLVELSLTIAIVAALSTLVAVVFNPAELSAQMRDGQRFAAVGTLREIVGVLVAENPAAGFGATNRVFISLPDTSHDCPNVRLLLPSPPAGRTYHCVTAANLNRIDGQGWLPVNFTAIRGGSPISVLPIDPINDSSFFYEYIPAAHHRYTFSARIESIRYRAQGPIFTKRFMGPFNFNVSPSPASGTIMPGETIATTVTATLISGTAREVSFSVSDLPVGTTASFSPTSCNPTCHSTLNIVTSATTPTSTHSITVIGTGGGVARRVTYTLGVGAAPTFALTVNSSGITGVAITGAVSEHGGTTNYTRSIISGTAVALTAPSAATGGVFSSWTGCDFVSGDGNRTCNLTLNAARTVIANYTAMHNLSVSVSGTGTVTSSPAGINCTTGTCSAAFAQGTNVSLTATPGANQSFAGWSGACTGTGACSVSMTAAQSVTATFSQITHTLSVTVSGTGTITGTGINCPGDCSETFNQGTNVSLTATPGANQSFAGWSGACTGTGACSVSMTAAQSVTATFNPITHVLTVNSSGVAGVAITSGTGHGGTTNYTRTITQGTAVALTAPSTSGGANFSSWTGCDSVTTTTTCNLTMNAARTVTANYVLPTFTLTVNSSGATGVVITSGTGHGGTTNYTRTITQGTAVALTAPSTSGGQNFSSWTGCDSVSGTTCNLTMNAARTVTANYTVPTHALTVTVSGTGTVTGTGINCPGDCSETFNQGTNVSLTATPGANQSFAGWSGACTGTGACSVSMTAARSVTASFAPLPTVSISASPNPIASGASSTITWSSTNATSCSWTAGFSGAAATSGNQSTGALTAARTYTLSCMGAGGSASNSVTVTILADLVILNSASGLSCDFLCSQHGRSCLSVGTDDAGTNSWILWWVGDVCQMGTTTYPCLITTGNTGVLCDGILSAWTRCRCR